MPGVSLSTGPGVSTATDASGYYTLTGLISGTYTLTPTKSGYTFSPPSRTVSVPPSASGQDFTASAPATFEDTGSVFTPVLQGSMAWGDYDNDGDLDVLLVGNFITKLYRNDAGVFTETSTVLPGVAFGCSVAWGDYDNDGDLDILLTGESSGGPITRIYRNDGGNFVDIGAALTGVNNSSVAWGDYDNDGDLDILLTGENGSGRTTKVYRNDGGGIFTDIGAGLTGVALGSVAWGDYDNDGDLDILLTGSPVTDNRIAKVYRNDGGNFVDIGAALTPVEASSVAWGDYDNDGDLDILMTGCTVSGCTASTAKVYRNNGNGTFTDISATLTPVINGSAAWGDYDNDGDLDILLTGYAGNGVLVSKVYRNDGNGVFTDINAPLPAVYNGSAIWGDYDNDGDLDILLAGCLDVGCGSRATKLYRNNTSTANTVPYAPTGLEASVAGNSVTLGWNAAYDIQTVSRTLTYNLRVGTTPGGSQVVAPMADASTGYRRVPQMGNANHGLTATVKNLMPGTYYWSVQAVDTAWAGSPFASEGSFTIGGATAGIITEQDLTGDGTLDLRLDNGIMWIQVNRDTVSGVKGFVDAGGISGQSNFMTYTVSSGGMVDQVAYWQTVSFTVQILTNTPQVGAYKVRDVQRANGKEVTKEYTVTLAAGREYAEIEYRFTNTGSSAWTYDETPATSIMARTWL